MAKLYRIDLNVDIKDVVPQLLINKTNQLEGGGYGEFTAPEYFKNIVMQAISMSHATGNMGVLRRTNSISKKFDEAVDSKLVLDVDDYRYIKSSMDKADKWNNNIEIAKSVLIVSDAINKAECVE